MLSNFLANCRAGDRSTQGTCSCTKRLSLVSAQGMITGIKIITVALKHSTGRHHASPCLGFVTLSWNCLSRLL